MLFWWLMSGHNAALLISLGVTSVVVVLILIYRLNIVDINISTIQLSQKLPRFILWLMKDIVLSNVNVAINVWRKKPQLNPKVFTISVPEKSDLATVIYANAITVTPGTITINIENNTMTVHALMDNATTNIHSGEKAAMVTKLVS